MNAKKLREKMKERDLSIADVANAIGVSRIDLYRKLSGKRPITIHEVVCIKEVLNLTNLEALEIFLARETA